MLKKTNFGECVYCRKIKSVEREHVIPRCLFPKPVPSFMLTVPVCRACNKAKGKLDEYVRDVLVLDIDCSNNAAARKLLNGEVGRAIRKNRSEVARAAKKGACLEPRYTPGGIYLGDAVSFPIDGERMNREFSLITRGLYYAIRKEHLPIDCAFDVRRVHPLRFHQIWEALKK